MCTIYSFISALGIIPGDRYKPDTFPIYEAEEKQDDALRILSYNIRYGQVNGVSRLFRSEIGLKQIEQIKPDSFGVQEATPEWMRFLREGLEDYADVGVARDDGNNLGEYCAVFYDKTVYDCLDSGNFWLSTTPEKPSRDWNTGSTRICTWAKLKNRETGFIYVHVNTHLDNASEEARDKGSALIVDFIKENFADIPVVLTADLNSHSDEVGYINLTSVLNDSKLIAAEKYEYGTFHDGKPEKIRDDVIDYVLCSDDFDVLVYKVVTAGIDGRMTSDHFPIYADLKVK